MEINKAHKTMHACKWKNKKSRVGAVFVFECLFLNKNFGDFKEKIFNEKENLNLKIENWGVWKLRDYGERSTEISCLRI